MKTINQFTDPVAKFDSDIKTLQTALGLASLARDFAALALAQGKSGAADKLAAAENEVAGYERDITRAQAARRALIEANAQARQTDSERELASAKKLCVEALAEKVQAAKRIEAALSEFEDALRQFTVAGATARAGVIVAAEFSKQSLSNQLGMLDFAAGAPVGVVQALHDLLARASDSGSKIASMVSFPTLATVHGTPSAVAADEQRRVVQGFADWSSTPAEAQPTIEVLHVASRVIDGTTRLVGQ